MDNTYTYFGSSTQEEIELTNSILKNINIENKDELLNVTDSITELPFNKQLHVVHCILDTLYTKFMEPDLKTENVGLLLSQKTFNTHRDIIMTIVDEDLSEEERTQKLTDFENTFNIKIKVTED